MGLVKIINSFTDTLSYVGPNTYLGTRFDLSSSLYVSSQYTITCYTNASITFASTAVDTLTSIINLTSHAFFNGQRCQVSNPGTLPTGISALTNYYVIKIDNSNFRLATSYANAIAGVYVSITGQGSGTNTLVNPINIQTFLAAAVDTTANTITMTNHSYATGVNVVISNPGTLPAPLTATTYYVIVVDSNTIKLATTLVNAQAGTAIDLTTQGSGTNTLTISPASTTALAQNMATNPLAGTTLTEYAADQIASNVFTSINPVLTMFERINPAGIWCINSFAATQGIFDVTIKTIVKGYA